MGAGDWRQDTDQRPAPPRAQVGDRRVVVGGLVARVEAVDARNPRLRTVRFDRTGRALTAAMYAAGAPVQYRYMDRAVPLAAVQTVYAGRPWAVEMPSAGRLLSWAVLDALAARGVGVATLTHAAGLSATGDPGLDARLPLPERYEIPAVTQDRVRGTRAAGGRVVAAGTSVVRALEGDAAAGSPGSGVTDLRLGPRSRLALVDGLISNLHVPGESHFELWRAFAPAELLSRAVAAAAGAGWLGHEFGDHALLLPGAALSASSNSR
jgi:S-adenosylmethionine:tRNA ribosyltransferase-isomerase